MKNGSDYKTDSTVAVLLIGNPGSGKTNLCFEWPSPYILDCDRNLSNAILRHPCKEFWFDTIDEVEPEERWKRLCELLKENGPRPEVKTIVCDSLSRLDEYLCDHLVKMGSQAEKPLTIGGVKVMTQSLWNPYKTLMTRFIMTARSFGKPFILTAHVATSEDDVSKVIMQRASLPGQLKDKLASMFTDFWMCKATPSSDPKYAVSNGVRYYVRTAPDFRVELKSSVRMPAEFDFTWPAYQELLAKANAGAKP